MKMFTPDQLIAMKKKFIEQRADEERRIALENVKAACEELMVDLVKSAENGKELEASITVDFDITKIGKADITRALGWECDVRTEIQFLITPQKIINVKISDSVWY